MWYTVHVLDETGYEVNTPEEAESDLKKAMDKGREYLKTKKYLEAGAYKAEVRNERGECIWDKFVEPDTPAFESWLKPNSNNKGVDALMTAITLSGLENHWLQLSTKTQLDFLGAVFFGKQRVKLLNGHFFTPQRHLSRNDFKLQLSMQ